jgi:hypothetical protein
MSDLNIMRWGDAWLATPHDLDELVASWDALRRPLLREVPDAFTRDEWAYLLAFIEADSLRALLAAALGPRERKDPVRSLLRPRGEIALWLPNNVSLLGPLMLVLVSLCGCAVRVKLGSHSQDLTSGFLAAARAHAQAPLAEWLAHRVAYAAFDHEDQRQVEMAASSRVQVFFGGRSGAEAIMRAPRAVDAVWLPFIDRRSEAWIEPRVLSESVLAAILRVFAIYGQAGCTSPRRIVLLDADMRAARALRDGLVALWPRVISTRRLMHQASANVMAHQWACGLGWDAALVRDNAAVIACGDLSLPEVDAPMLLPIVPASREEAAAALPANIQTLGHALADPAEPALLELLARSRVARFVGVAEMHHFGARWDGYELLRSLFEHVEMET